MSAEAEYLRRVLDKQPACLMRIAADGQVLATSDAAQALLGSPKLADVLGHAFIEWITPAHHDGWREFSQSVSAGTSRSMECDLLVAGALRHVVLHGVALPDHPDGVRSMILGIRDESALRRLEAAVQETDAIRQKLPQFEALLKQGRTHLQDLRTRLDEATRERDRLLAQLSEREAANEQLWAEQVQLGQSLAERHERELNEQRAQLAAVADREAEYERLRSEHATLRQSADALQQEICVLRSTLQEAAAARMQLADALAERVRGHEQAAAEFEEQRRLTTGAHERALHALHAEIDRHASERDDLAARLIELAAERDRLSAQLREVAADRHRLAEQLRDSEKALADQRVELQSTDRAARWAEAMAAAGRLAVGVSQELQTTAADIDARAACLVAECPVESSLRDQVEQLRADAARAASLARQIQQASRIGHPEEQKSC